MIVFGAIRGASSVDGFDFAEIVGGVKLSSKGWGAAFAVVRVLL